MSDVRRSLHRVPACPVQVMSHRPCRVKTAQEEGLWGEGALVLVLTGRVDLAFLHGQHGYYMHQREMSMLFCWNGPTTSDNGTLDMFNSLN